MNFKTQTELTTGSIKRIGVKYVSIIGLLHVVVGTIAIFLILGDWLLTDNESNFSKSHLVNYSYVLFVGLLLRKCANNFFKF